MAGTAFAIPQEPLREVEVVADGLAVPEGPVALSDGSVLVTEIARGTLTRIDPSGRAHVAGACGGGPNGAAVGPDGAIYVCNNGGRFTPETWVGGRIERVDLSSGTVDVLFESCDGRPLSAPNDLVFDAAGGFYFTDAGKLRDRVQDRGSVYYAHPDGSRIVELVHPAEMPNGVGLSLDGATLYFTETFTAQLHARRIEAPGRLATLAPNETPVLVGLPGSQKLDSLAVDSEGNVCVGTINPGCVTVIAPDGSAVTQLLLPDELADARVTNLCFGGPDLCTAFLTLAETGRLVRCRWPVPGAALHFLI